MADSSERAIRLRFRLVVTLINASFRQRNLDTSILLDDKIIFPRPGADADLPLSVQTPP